MAFLFFQTCLLGYSWFHSLSAPQKNHDVACPWRSMCFFVGVDRAISRGVIWVLFRSSWWHTGFGEEHFCQFWSPHTLSLGQPDAFMWQQFHLLPFIFTCCNQSMCCFHLRDNMNPHAGKPNSEISDFFNSNIFTIVLDWVPARRLFPIIFPLFLQLCIRSKFCPILIKVEVLKISL